MGEVDEIVCLERVLKLSAAETATDAEILDGLQIKSGARNPGGFRANAADDLIRAEFAFAERLELGEHARGAATVAAAGESGDGINSGILHDDVGKFTHLLGHGGEGKILIALDQTVDAAGVLLREEALGRPDKQINVQADRAEGDKQDEELVTKNPAEGNIVGAQQTIERVLGKSIETIVPAGFVAKEAGAHHGRGGKRNEKRNADVYDETQRKNHTDSS